MTINNYEKIILHIPKQLSKINLKIGVVCRKCKKILLMKMRNENINLVTSSKKTGPLGVIL